MKSVSVLKFGGSSLSSPERINRVARIVGAHRKWRPEENTIVVVSAMGDTTDDLLSLAHQVSPRAFESSRRREMDMLLSTGERISMSLLSLALADQGLDAVSLTGSQSGIITSDFHGEARIQSIKPIRIDEAFLQKKIVIVAGFQGVSDKKEITTLGRGGSDTSAVALGAHFKAREVYIYTDVDGLYNADPRIVPNARSIKQINYRQAYLSALFGAQVLHSRCLEVGARYKISIRVLSSILEYEELKNKNFMERGTLILESTKGQNMEKPFINTLNQIPAVYRLKIPCPQSSLETLKQIQDSKLSWITLHHQNNIELEIVCNESMLDEYKKLFPALHAEGPSALLSFVGCGLNEAPELSSKIIEILQTQASDFQLINANNEALQFLVRCNSTQSPALNTLLPKLFELCQ